MDYEIQNTMDKRIENAFSELMNEDFSNESPLVVRQQRCARKRSANCLKQRWDVEKWMKTQNLEIDLKLKQIGKSSMPSCFKLSELP